MSIRRVLLVVLVASGVMLAVGVEPTRAVPSAREPDPPDETVLQPGQSDDVFGLTPQSLNAASTGGGIIGDNFAISNQSVDAVSPAVAYNSDREEYLVVWYNDRAGNDDIQAQRVSKNGALVGNAFYVAAGSGTDRRYPDVAYNSQQNEYLVVWEHKDGASYSIRAWRVPATGGTTGGEITVASPGFNEEFKKPTVGYAFTSDKYLVVWEYNWEFGVHIAGQVLSSSGALEGNVVSISNDPVGSPRYQPDVVYNRSRNEYLVVWQQNDSGNYNIYARRAQGNGTPMHPESITIATDAKDELEPAVAAIPTQLNQGQYLVVWEHRHSSTDGDIHARMVTGEGNPGSGIIISELTVDQTNPAVAGNESAGQYLVVWTQPSSGMLVYTGITGRAVSSGGALLGEETYFGGWSAEYAAVASGWSGDFLVALDDQLLLASSRDIYGQLWGNRVYLPLVLR